MSLEWMAWTLPTAVFFITIGVILIGMFIWQLISPTQETRGFLPIETTRGDRLFIGLLGSAYIHLAWIGLTDFTIWIALVISVVYAVVLMKFG